MIKSVVLKTFFDIPLSSAERKTALETIRGKYASAVSSSVIYSLLLLPALLLLDTQIVTSVLIPTTMVAGLAWYSVSLASLKQKFEAFGLELTTDLFVAFCLSLLMLFLATAVSLTRNFWIAGVTGLTSNAPIRMIAALLAIFVVARLLYTIFSGSLKYDINDAMLTGQNEAAEKYFKRSLSLLYSTADGLRDGFEPDVANYSIGIAFSEVFDDLKSLYPDQSYQFLQPAIQKTDELIANPEMEVNQANQLAESVTATFVLMCENSVPEIVEHKSFKVILRELSCLQGKTTESQRMVDMRIAVIVSNMAEIIEEYGSRLAVMDTPTKPLL